MLTDGFRRGYKMAQTKIKPSNITPESFQMMKTWFEKCYKGTKDDTITKFNDWMKNFAQGEDYAVSMMEDKGKQIWKELLEDKICVVVHPELENTTEHPLKKDPKVTVEGDVTGRIKQVCYPASFGVENILDKVPNILVKDNEGCKLCKVGAQAPNSLLKQGDLVVLKDDPYHTEYDYRGEAPMDKAILFNHQSGMQITVDKNRLIQKAADNRAYSDPVPVDGQNLRDPTTDEWDWELKRVREMDDSKLRTRITRIRNPQKMYNFGVVLDDEKRTNVASDVWNALASMGWDSDGKWIGAGSQPKARKKTTPSQTTKKLFKSDEDSESYKKMEELHHDIITNYTLDDDMDWTLEQQKKYVEEWMSYAMAGTLPLPLSEDLMKHLVKTNNYRLYELFVRLNFSDGKTDKERQSFQNLDNDDTDKEKGLFSEYFKTYDEYWFDVYTGKWWHHEEEEENPTMKKLSREILHSKIDAEHFIEDLFEKGISESDINYEFDDANTEWVVEWLDRDKSLSENPHTKAERAKIDKYKEKFKTKGKEFSWDELMAEAKKISEISLREPIQHTKTELYYEYLALGELLGLRAVDNPSSDVEKQRRDAIQLMRKVAPELLSTDKTVCVRCDKVLEDAIFDSALFREKEKYLKKKEKNSDIVYGWCSDCYEKELEEKYKQNPSYPPSSYFMSVDEWWDRKSLEDRAEVVLFLPPEIIKLNWKDLPKDVKEKIMNKYESLTISLRQDYGYSYNPVNEHKESFKICSVCGHITPYVSGRAICDECKRGRVRPPPAVVVVNPVSFTPGTPEWLKKEYEFNPPLGDEFRMRVDDNYLGKTVFAIETAVDEGSVDEPFDITPVFETFDELLQYWNEFGAEILEERDSLGDRENFMNWVNWLNNAYDTMQSIVKKYPYEEWKEEYLKKEGKKMENPEFLSNASDLWEEMSKPSRVDFLSKDEYGYSDGEKSAYSDMPFDKLPPIVQTDLAEYFDDVMSDYYLEGKYVGENPYFDENDNYSLPKFAYGGENPRPKLFYPAQSGTTGAERKKQVTRRYIPIEAHFRRIPMANSARSDVYNVLVRAENDIIEILGERDDVLETIQDFQKTILEIAASENPRPKMFSTTYSGTTGAERKKQVTRRYIPIEAHYRRIPKANPEETEAQLDELTDAQEGYQLGGNESE